MHTTSIMHEREWLWCFLQRSTKCASHVFIHWTKKSVWKEPSVLQEVRLSNLCCETKLPQASGTLKLTPSSCILYEQACWKLLKWSNAYTHSSSSPSFLFYVEELLKKQQKWEITDSHQIVCIYFTKLPKVHKLSQKLWSLLLFHIEDISLL